MKIIISQDFPITVHKSSSAADAQRRTTYQDFGGGNEKSDECLRERENGKGVIVRDGGMGPSQVRGKLMPLIITFFAICFFCKICTSMCGYSEFQLVDFCNT